MDSEVKMRVHLSIYSTTPSAPSNNGILNLNTCCFAYLKDN